MVHLVSSAHGTRQYRSNPLGTLTLNLCGLAPPEKRFFSHIQEVEHKQQWVPAIGNPYRNMWVS